MKICFMDISEIQRYALSSIRLLDLQMFFDNISDCEDDDEKLIFKVYANFTPDAKKKNDISFLSQLNKLKEQYDAKRNRSFKIINSYNNEIKRNMPEIAMVNGMYQDYIDNIDEPNHHILVTTTSKYLSTADYIQRQSRKQCKLYMPSDHPLLPQVVGIFRLGGTFDLEENKKTIEDIIVLKQIFFSLLYAKKNRFPMGMKNLVNTSQSSANIRPSDTTFMLSALIRADILETFTATANNTNFIAVRIKDRERTNQFLSKNGIDIFF